MDKKQPLLKLAKNASKQLHLMVPFPSENTMEEFSNVITFPLGRKELIMLMPTFFCFCRIGVQMKS